MKVLDPLNVLRIFIQNIKCNPFVLHVSIPTKHLSPITLLHFTFKLQSKA